MNKPRGETLFSEDIQKIWNKLDQITEILKKMNSEIKHTRRDIQDLEERLK